MALAVLPSLRSKDGQGGRGMTETDYTIQKMRRQIQEVRRQLAQLIAENKMLKEENDRLFRKVIDHEDSKSLL